MKLIDTTIDKKAIKNILRNSGFNLNHNKSLQKTLGEENIFIFELWNDNLTTQYPGLLNPTICIGVTVGLSAIFSSMCFIALPQQYLKVENNRAVEWINIDSSNYFDFLGNYSPITGGDTTTHAFDFKGNNLNTIDPSLWVQSVETQLVESELNLYSALHMDPDRSIFMA